MSGLLELRPRCVPADAMWQIREILADGSVEELRTRCEALRRLLAAVDAGVAPR